MDRGAGGLPCMGLQSQRQLSVHVHAGHTSLAQQHRDNRNVVYNERVFTTAERY